MTRKDIKDLFSGNDGKLSIRRILATTLILSGIILTSIVSFSCEGHIEAQTLLIAPLFASGLTLFGITGYFQMKDSKNQNPTE